MWIIFLNTNIQSGPVEKLVWHLSYKRCLVVIFECVRSFILSSWACNVIYFRKLFATMSLLDTKKDFVGAGPSLMGQKHPFQDFLLFLVYNNPQQCLWSTVDMTVVCRTQIRCSDGGGERLIKGVMKSPDIDSSGGVEIDGWYNLLACRNSGVGFSNGWGNRFSEGKDGLSSQL